ncbi:hypothetical protein GOP47_0017865 [Adiantum capillus-veneris]|uniref:Poly [ADP-ribose] polymerase n=1 Tax=Adiantum capillus-veneris TaxID=13818 RepID=A0A9D4UGM6_ADICA|nr:hypothetical protein GOP47_0017865 [Adiantum capillus-veneris]
MATPPQPFKAEYAKSNRSTCKSCQSIIVKDSFRIARVVPATQFEGYMTVWNHASCIFKKKGQIKSLEDIEGLDNLRWDDQQKIRAYVENSAPSDGGDSAKGVADGDYAIEAAKSSRAACKSCNEKIEKGQVRVSTMVTSESSKFRGKVPAWRHAKCFFELNWWKEPLEEFPGWEELSIEDQKTVQELVNPGSLKGKNAVNTKEIPKQKGTKRKGKEQDESAATSGQQKRGRKSEVQQEIEKAKSATGKQKGIERAKSTTDKQKGTNYDKQLETQSKALWSIKDELKKNVDTNELRMMLEENGQETSGSEYDLRERCADGMLFGALGPCPTCNGPIEIHGGQYRCRGNLSEWSKCTYTTRSPERLQGKWKIPEDSDNSYLKKWFKSQKAKKEKRLFSTKLPSAENRSENSEKEKLEGKVQGSALEGLKVAIIGKEIQAKWKRLIQDVGGQLLKEMTPEVDCVVTSELELVLEDNKANFQSALGLRIPIVKEDFLVDCFDRGGLVPVNQYVLETVGKFSSTKKVKVKGRSAVHEDSELQDVGHILEDGNTIYNTTLSLSDLSTGVNSYYVLQIIEHDNKDIHHLFRRWGRVGNSKIGGSKCDKMSKSGSIREFKKLFREKTGNEWEAWQSKVNFHKQPNRFYPIEIDYGTAESSNIGRPLGTKSKLHPRVVSLMKMLFDIETYKAAMMEFEINMSEMPLGKLSKRNIEQAFQVLTEVQNVLGNDDLDKRDRLLIDASNRFFTLVPHVHPRIISDEDCLKSKIDMLEALRDIEVAAKLIGSTGGDDDEDPLDINYRKLCCGIVPVPHDSDDFGLVKKYLENTHAPTHKEWSLELEDVFTVLREGEEDAFVSKKPLGNRMLLWHGSRTTNYVGILSQGLRIAPPEAPVTGYMFGKGVYFADLVSKSAQYCYTSKNSPIGLMLLSEVALGEMHELKAAQYMEKPPPGKHSTKGLGRNIPMEDEYQTWGDEVTVPCGRPVASGVSNTNLLYNEYIVYDTAQINLRFLLKVRFQHKGLQNACWGVFCSILQSEQLLA